MHYILDAEGAPVHEPNIIKWAQWFEENNSKRIVALTELPEDVRVSTVFLGVDHSFVKGEVHLFETMIFNGPLDETRCRYATREAALKGHDYYVGAAKMAANSL